MSLSITTNAAALNAYRALANQQVELDGATAGNRPAQTAPSSATRADSVELSTANQVAAASATIDDAELAAQLMLLAAAQITANPLGALAAQANSSADAALALLR